MWVVGIRRCSLSVQVFNIFVQFLEFVFVIVRQDREAVLGFGIQVLVIEVEGWCVVFLFLLVDVL